MGQLKDDTWSYYLEHWALFVDAKKTDRQMRIRLRLSTDVAEEDNGERFIGYVGGLGCSASPVEPS